MLTWINRLFNTEIPTTSNTENWEHQIAINNKLISLNQDQIKMNTGFNNRIMELNKFTTAHIAQLIKIIKDLNERVEILEKSTKGQS